jgi:16S rRNA (guanine527-N7)-methyltransferase
MRSDKRQPHPQKQTEEDRHVARRLVPVPRETGDRLAVFVDLLARWKSTTNLVSESSFASVWTRHVADSAQLYSLFPSGKTWVDMGSGAGFPGIVVAIQMTGVPGAVVHCVESDRRKCAFLREVARETGAPAIIHPTRVEAVARDDLGPVDAVTARGFAPLRLTLDSAKVWMERGAVGIFPRGRSGGVQAPRLDLDPAYVLELFPSVVDDSAVIFRVRLGREPQNGLSPPC